MSREARGARRWRKLQLEVSGAPDEQAMISELAALQGVTRVTVVPTFQ